MGIIDKIREYGLKNGYYSDANGYDEDEFEESAEETTSGKYATHRIERPARRELEPIAAPRTRGVSTVSTSNVSTRVVNMPGSFHSQIVISYPETMQEAALLSDYIKSNSMALVNLESVQHETAQRIVDFLGGVIYALGGEIQYVSNKVFVLAPNGTEITGQFKEELKANGILFSIR